MLEDGSEGHLSTMKYAKLAKCFNDTVLRDVRELLESGFLLQNLGGGRSAGCRLTDVKEFLIDQLP